MPLTAPKNVSYVCQDLTEEEFRRRLSFLQEVPLFRRLQKSQYPLLARILRAQRWQPGDTILDCDAAAKEFFLIVQGTAEARVWIDSRWIAESLRPGDYFGEKALLNAPLEKSSVKIVAVMGLVTLSLSAQAFKDFGLADHLRLPKRAVIGRDRHVPAGIARPSTTKSAEERQFIKQALWNNDNLRSLVDLKEKILDKIADVAEREDVSEGTTMMQPGKYGNQLYIVEEGMFEVGRAAQPAEDEMRQSSDVELLASEMRRRIQRKSKFFETLTVGRTPQDEGGLRRTEPNKFGADDSDDEDSGAKPSLRRTSALQASCTRSEPLELPHRASSSPTNGHKPMPKSASSSSGPDGGLFSKGSSFGEVSVLFNVPQTSSAVAIQDSKVWTISQAAFRRVMRDQQEARLEKVKAHLDEVDLLSGLLAREKYDLAQNFLKLSFSRDDLICCQDEKLHMWYVIIHGECVLTRRTSDESEEVLARLTSPLHFGERALLRDVPSEYSVKVVSETMKCLVLDGNTFKELMPLLHNDSVVRDMRELSLAEYVSRHLLPCEKTVGLLGAISRNKVDIKGQFIQRSSTRQSWGACTSLGSTAAPQLDPQVDARALKRVAMLGTGAFGTVTLEEDPLTGQRFAMKTLCKGYVVKQHGTKNIINEREILTMMDSVFVVRLHATYKDKNYVYLLFEPVLGGELHALIHKMPDKLTSPVIRFDVACLVGALEHLHERHVVFRDLKPENVLISKGHVPLWHTRVHCARGSEPDGLRPYGRLVGSWHHILRAPVAWLHAIRCGR